MRKLTIALLAALPVWGADRIVFNDDGGWCWFEDERVIVHDGKLIVGTIASGRTDIARQGDVEAVSYDLKTGKSARTTLHAPTGERERRQWYDDHNSPAFLATQDGSVLAMYAKHGPENRIYYRQSADDGSWGEERIFVPSESSRITYSNLHLLRSENGGKGRIYDFFRGLNDSYKPSFVYSDDGGRSWTTGNVVIDVPSEERHRPYAKYVSNGKDTVHIVYTEGHPHNYDNSIYHIFYRNGVLHESSGKPIRELAAGLKKPEEGTLVFKGGGDRIAWTTDIQLDPQGNPYMVYSVQTGDAGKPQDQRGNDLRYRYARWNGRKWIDREIAYAGTRIYQREHNYSGLAALDPHDANTVFISTNADPATGAPLVSKTDGKRHWEIFQGTTLDGVTWRWSAVTKDSAHDNLRPVVPVWAGDRRALLWLEGEMRAYTDYSFRVVGLISQR